MALWYIYIYIYIHIHTHIYTYTMEYYSAINEKENLSFATTRMTWGIDNTLSEVNQTEKDIYCKLSLTEI